MATDQKWLRIRNGYGSEILEMVTNQKWLWIRNGYGSEMATEVDFGIRFGFVQPVQAIPLE